MSDPTDAAAVIAYWNARAARGAQAGTDDLLLKRLEIRYLTSFLRPQQFVLDIGCGTGETLLALAARERTVYGCGWDAAPQMVAVAARAAHYARLANRIEFVQRTVEHGCPTWCGDLVYTERLCINLGTWERQREAIGRLAGMVCTGGKLVLVEHSQDALDRLNGLRRRVGLPLIAPPWHNRYLREAEVAALDGWERLRLERVDHFTATYYLLSRVVNAWLAARAGRAPRYDAWINRLALHLPALGHMGQCVGWVFTKEGSRGRHDRR